MAGQWRGVFRPKAICSHSYCFGCVCLRLPHVTRKSCTVHCMQSLSCLCVCLSATYSSYLPTHPTHTPSTPSPLIFSDSLSASLISRRHLTSCAGSPLLFPLLHLTVCMLPCLRHTITFKLLFKACYAKHTHTQRIAVLPTSAPLILALHLAVCILPCLRTKPKCEGGGQVCREEEKEE